MNCLSAEKVIAIHEQVAGSNELQGMALIESVLARINNRAAYGMIEDVSELAACYACYIAVGHVFNDANERTAFTSMDTCLRINGIELDFDIVKASEMIIKAAQGIVDEKELAEWLRDLAQ